MSDLEKCRYGEVPAGVCLEANGDPSHPRRHGMDTTGYCRACKIAKGLLTPAPETPRKKAEPAHAASTSNYAELLSRVELDLAAAGRRYDEAVAARDAALQVIRDVDAELVRLDNLRRSLQALVPKRENAAAGGVILAYPTRHAA